MDITKSKIFDEIKQDKSINSFNNEKVGPFEISAMGYKARFSSFTEITFSHIFSLIDVDLSIGLLFENCRFLGPVNLENINAFDVDPNLNPHSQSIVFRKCYFHDIFLFKGYKNTIDRDIFFEDCEFHQDLEIFELTIVQGSLYFKNCTFNKKLDIVGAKISMDIRFEDNTVSGITRLNDNVCFSLVIIQNNVFSAPLLVYGGKFQQGIIFNNGLFNEEIIFEAIETIESGLTLFGSSFQKAFIINIHSLQKALIRGISSFHISDASFSNGIYVNGTQDLFADYPIVDTISLNISANLKGDIVFRDIQVGILNVSGYNTSANISIERLFVNQLKIKGLINSAGLIFSALRASYITWYRDKEKKLIRDNAIYIDDSNFGKAQFFQTDFSAFETIVFHNVICTDISTSLVKWFTPSQLDRGTEKYSKFEITRAKKTKDKQKIKNAIASIIADYSSKKEIYRQLKFASQKQGDIPLSLEFQSYEMNYYRKIVYFKRPRNYSEILILWSSQSNNFGQSWLKPLGLFVAFSFVFYLPIAFLNSTELDYYSFASSWSDVFLNFKVVFYNNLHSWIVILNPVHSMKDINENIKDFSKWIYFWDFLSRIISSYFIFQIVSAFRKYLK